MTHQNLVLTEKAIKAHSKRLQKELKNYNQNLSLSETQNLFSKTLGFNNFYELKKVLNCEENIINENIGDDFKIFMKSYEERQTQKRELRTKNNFLVLEYLSECIKNDDVLLYLKNIKNINIEYDTTFIFEQLTDKQSYEIIKYILSNKKIDNLNNKKLRALESACFYGNFEIVEYLTEKFNIKINSDILQMACYNENIKILTYIINKYKKQNKKNIDFTDLINKAVIMSCERGNFKNFEFLLNLPNNLILENVFELIFIKKNDKEEFLFYKNNIENRKLMLLHLIHNHKFEKTKKIELFLKQS